MSCAALGATAVAIFAAPSGSFAAAVAAFLKRKEEKLLSLAPIAAPSAALLGDEVGEDPEEPAGLGSL